jgi:hypothetical protein
MSEHRDRVMTMPHEASVRTRIAGEKAMHRHERARMPGPAAVAHVAMPSGATAVAAIGEIGSVTMSGPACASTSASVTAGMHAIAAGSKDAREGV